MLAGLAEVPGWFLVVSPSTVAKQVVTGTSSAFPSFLFPSIYSSFPFSLLNTLNNNTTSYGALASALSQSVPYLFSFRSWTCCLQTIFYLTIRCPFALGSHSGLLRLGLLWGSASFAKLSHLGGRLQPIRRVLTKPHSALCSFLSWTTLS
ncbi:hypothetical protein QBC42DRAFT_272724, partial [Cladorrhinum samala]